MFTKNLEVIATDLPNGTRRIRRYRGSTQETKSVKAQKVASLKLASIIENTDQLPSKSTGLSDFSGRFLAWVDTARLEEMTRKSYRNGWRLLKATLLLTRESTRSQAIVPSN